MLTEEQEKQVQAMGAKIMAKLRQECAQAANENDTLVFKVSRAKGRFLAVGYERVKSERL